MCNPNPEPLILGEDAEAPRAFAAPRALKVRVLTREVFVARGSNLPQLDLECETRLLCHLAGGMHGAKAGDVGKGELMATVLAKRLMVSAQKSARSPSPGPRG